MASVLPMDDLHVHDDSNDEDDISRVEWTKLKLTHMKEGYRDGYSAGQETALQPAFNQSFAQHVRKEACVAFYRGILTALKAFAEKNTLGQKSRKISGSVNMSQIASLLAELDSIAGKTDLTEGSSASVPNVNTESDCTYGQKEREKELEQSAEDKLTSSEHEKKHLESEGGITVEQTACTNGECSQSTCKCVDKFVETQHTEGGSAVETVSSRENSKCACSFKSTDLKEMATNVETGDCRDSTLKNPSHTERACTTPTESDFSMVKFRKIFKKCKQLLNELGIEDTLQSNPCSQV